MELVWEDLPDNESTFFTRDVYDKYSLAPNIKELWALSQSPTVNVDVKVDCRAGVAQVDSSQVPTDAAEVTGSVGQDECSVWESFESNTPSAKSKVKNKHVKDEAIAYPQPRLPYPCMSSLSSKDQKTYLIILMSKKPREPPQALKVRVHNEVSQFMNYLRDVSRMCADDYNSIPQGALQYSEDFLRNCIECMRIFPQVYQIKEITSLTGGSFNPGLAFTFEKQLLVMGSVGVTNHMIVPAGVNLALDYHSVASEYPPAKKAKDKYAQTISSDSNAERLCAHYEPHVCLTADALVRLLDNHGPEFNEAWELPVWVKLGPGKGNSKKTVYIDSPLLKTEVTTRERSHIFHEESLKLSINKTSMLNVFHLMTEVPAADKQLPPESSQRNLVSFDEPSLEFERDLTDLETFGEATVKPSKKHNSQLDAFVKSEPAERSPLARCMTTRSRASLRSKTTGGSTKEGTTLSTDKEDSEKGEPLKPGSSPAVPNASLLRQDSTREREEDPTVAGDSEDERLVIDDLTEGTPTPAHSSGDPAPTAETLSPNEAPAKRHVSKRASVAGDQLGQILRMQATMLKTDKEPLKTSVVCLEPIVLPCATGLPVQLNATPLVKPCVSSYLQSGQHQDGETSGATRSISASSLHTVAVHKKLLSQELQESAEAEEDYEAPERGNLLYKLYSLTDLLIMVRSSVPLTHTRRVGGGSNQLVPVHVLPKLEYQLCYGVECLSRSEACRLWAETLLHSSTVAHIAHIDAFTSKVALLRTLPEDWKQKLSCDFKPSKSLNILHHLLKKITGLEEGRYLMGHKAGEPFVTILKAADEGTVARGGYNLQHTHSTVPHPPGPGAVPWLPVDPSVVLPYHKKHGRVPCTFPPTDLQKTVGEPTQSKDGNSKTPRSQQSNTKAGGKKKNKGKRAARRKKWIENHIQRSSGNPNAEV